MKMIFFLLGICLAQLNWAQFKIEEISFNKSTLVDTVFTEDGSIQQIKGTSPFGYVITYDWVYHANGEVQKESRVVDLEDFDYPIQYEVHLFNENGAFLFDSSRSLRPDTTWKGKSTRWDRDKNGKKTEVYYYNVDGEIQQQEHWSKGKLTSTSYFEYDKKGLIKREEFRDEEDKVLKYRKYFYEGEKLSHTILYKKSGKKIDRTNY